MRQAIIFFIILASLAFTSQTTAQIQQKDWWVYKNTINQQTFLSNETFTNTTSFSFANGTQITAYFTKKTFQTPFREYTWFYENTTKFLAGFKLNTTNNDTNSVFVLRTNFFKKNGTTFFEIQGNDITPISNSTTRNILYANSTVYRQNNTYIGNLTIPFNQIILHTIIQYANYTHINHVENGILNNTYIYNNGTIIQQLSNFSSGLTYKFDWAWSKTFNIITYFRQYVIFSSSKYQQNNFLAQIGGEMKKVLENYKFQSDEKQSSVSIITTTQTNTITTTETIIQEKFVTITTTTTQAIFPALFFIALFIVRKKR